MKQNKNILYYLILSTTAAAIILLLSFVKTSTTNTVTINDKLLVAGAFIASCIFGISIAIYPGWHKKLIKKESHNLNKQLQKPTRKRKGHHPDCQPFKSHTITIKNKTLCAGCLGLSTGAILAIILTILYINTPLEQTNNLYHILIILGLTIISLTYIEIMLPTRKPIIHVISNILLVISFLLITISILEITKNTVYGLIAILLSFLWLDTRIQLSQWQHTRICHECTENCKTY